MTWELATGYVFFLVLVLWFLFAIANYATHRRFWAHRHYELLLIQVPLAAEVQPFAAQHTPSEVGATLELIERLAAHHASFAFEVAVHHVGEEIHFYLYIPRRLKSEILKDVQHLFPGAKAIPGDYDLWMEGGEVEVAYVHQAKPALVPLKSAVAPTADTFADVLRRLSHLKVLGEGAAIQWVVRPLATKRRSEYVQTIQSLKAGGARSFRHLDEGFLVTPQTIELLDRKLDSPLFSVNCRVVVSHAKETEAKRILRGIGEVLTPAGAGMLYNELYLAPAKKVSRGLGLFATRGFDEKEEMILNAVELASVFHFPTRHSQSPKAHRG